MSRQDQDVKADSQICLEYLQEIQKRELSENDIRNFKTIHKIAYRYLQLENLLEEKESKQYFKEIVSNIIHLLYSSNMFNKKIINMLNRNTIDNMIKIARLEFGFGADFSKKHIEEKFKEIKNYNLYCGLNAYGEILDYILNQYKTACGYVHSTKISYLTLYENIKDYYEDSYRIDNVVKFYKRILFILLVIYEKDLKTKNHEILCKIRSFVEKDKLREYLNFFYSANF